MKNKELELITGKVIFEAWEPTTKMDILNLLQKGETPKQIESNIFKILEKDRSTLPKWKLKEIAGRYYLGAKYAKENNLHLNQYYHDLQGKFFRIRQPTLQRPETNT